MCDHPKPLFAIGDKHLYCGRCGAIKRRTDLEWRLPTLRLEHATKPKKKPVYESDLEFESWWSLYPKKDAKQDAIKAWVQTKGIRPDLDTLKRAVNAYTAFKKGGSPRMIAHAATWLRGRQWEDESIKRFMPEDKPEPKPVDPKLMRIRDLESQVAALKELGSERALKIAGEIQVEIEGLENNMKDKTHD